MAVNDEAQRAALYSEIVRADAQEDAELSADARARLAALEAALAAAGLER